MDINTDRYNNDTTSFSLVETAVSLCCFFGGTFLNSDPELGTTKVDTAR